MKSLLKENFSKEKIFQLDQHQLIANTDYIENFKMKLDKETQEF